MKIVSQSRVYLTAILLGCGLINGCGPAKLAKPAELDATIGHLVEIVTPEATDVQGYSLVGGLNGTGSSECPPQIRAYLARYIPTQLSDTNVNVSKFIDSLNTAVVRVEGTIPAAASKNQAFDVRVAALAGTQTTSLENGWLYGAELKPRGSFGITIRVPANAHGPVFIDTLGPLRTSRDVGYVLGGGKVIEDFAVILVLRRPDYRVTGAIRDRLNERFGFGTARATSPNQVVVVVPEEYREKRQRFVSLVGALFLAETPQNTAERINTFVRKLAVSDEKYESEIALEAIGRESIGKLGTLLNSSDERIRFHAARCMLYLGSDRGLEVLGRVAMDANSSRRIEALEAITAAARRNDAAATARKLLRDSSFAIRYVAYEQLHKLDDIAVTRRHIARSFYLEEVSQTQYRTVYVSRSGEPRIVLFGGPVYCRGNIFVQSQDGSIIINAPAGQGYVSVIRKHPTRPSVVAQLRSSFELSDIIRTLCEEPSKETEEAWRGLGVSYADMIALIRQLCDKGFVRAEFRAGPLPKIG